MFSFGRDHGYFGRILAQTVVPMETLAVRGNELVGFCFTPQDGNPLLSTVAGMLWYLDPDTGRRADGRAAAVPVPGGLSRVVGGPIGSVILPW